MDSSDGQQSIRAEAPTVFRCARCGVESAEPTCFVIPERYSKPPRDVRCITCEQRRLAPSTLLSITSLVTAIFWPLLLVAGFQRGQADLGLPSLLFACVLYPLAVIAHELGHAITARLVGLELGTIGIGSGRVAWKFEIGGLPIRLHMVPFSGRIHLGASSTHLLRTRLWLAILMGPATNALLVAATVVWWAPLEAVVGTPAITLWFAVNFLMTIINLIPQRIPVEGYVARTDGLQLLSIPRKTPAELSAYLFAAPLVRAFSRFEDDDFAGARLKVSQALEEAPDNVVLRVMQSACYISAGEYRVGLETLQPLLGRAVDETAYVRAAIYNNIAIGLVMSAHNTDACGPRLLEAERLSAAAFLLYPCVLEYRSTRAFVFTATGHAEQTLRLLDYSLYEAASARQRGHREAARAFALRHLHRLSEAEEAAAMAVRLYPPNRAMLRTLGFSLLEDQPPANAA